MAQEIEYGKRQIGIYKDPFYNTDGCPKCGYKNEVKYYNVIFSKGEDGYIIITSPDFPELITQGKDEREAIINTHECLELILEDIEETTKKFIDDNKSAFEGLAKK